jgi:phosphoglucosamine mutase
VLRSVRLASRPDDLSERLAPHVAAAESLLGESGRVLIRPSGTEPVVRVMVEAPTEDVATQIADELVAAVTAAGAATS